MYRNGIHFLSTCYPCSFSPWDVHKLYLGGRPFSLIYIIFLIREESVNLGFSFWNKIFEKPSLSIETQFLDSSSWTHPVQSPVHSESSVMNRLHCNVIMNILHQVSLCELRGSLMVSHEKSSPLTLRVKMGHLNCCSGGRFLLILCRLFLQMGWLTVTDFLSSFFFFSFPSLYRDINVLYSFVLFLNLYFLVLLSDGHLKYIPKLEKVQLPSDSFVHTLP